MNKYNLDIQNGKMGKNGLAEIAGWVKCYLAHPVTREYMGATMENVMFDVSLSASAYLDKPELPKTENQAIRRNASDSAWEIVDDYRGKTAYHTQTKQSITIDFIGELPDTLTLLAPENEFDKWDNNQWIIDKEAIKKSQIDAAVQQKLELAQEAENRITQLERKVRLEMASKEEIELLTKWEIFTVKLDDINTEMAPNITWPEKPQ